MKITIKMIGQIGMVEIEGASSEHVELIKGLQPEIKTKLGKPSIAALKKKPARKRAKAKKKVSTQKAKSASPFVPWREYKGQQ